MAFSMPRALSSAQPNVFGTFAWKAPILVGCHAEMNAPEGSWNTAMRPWSATSKGGAITVPPPDCTLATRSSASVSYTHLRAHETPEHLVCRLLLEKKKK